MTRCLAPDCQMGGLGCDNMTVVLVCFLQPPGDYSELCRRCAAATCTNGVPDMASTPSGADELPDCLQVAVDTK
jgi:hypothetical protein